MQRQILVDSMSLHNQVNFYLFIFFVFTNLFLFTYNNVPVLPAGGSSCLKKLNNRFRSSTQRSITSPFLTSFVNIIFDFYFYFIFIFIFLSLFFFLFAN